MDLTKIDPLVTKIGNLSAALESQLPIYANQVKSARDAAERFDSNSNELIALSDEYIDLADLASELKQRMPDSVLQKAAQDVMESVNTYVIGNISESGNKKFQSTTLDPNRVHGVSIFFPTGDLNRSFYNGLNLDFASDTIWNLPQGHSVLSLTGTRGWGSFLVDYVSTITPSALDDPNPPGLGSPEPVSSLNRNNSADTTSVFRPNNGLLYLKNANPSGFADVALNDGLSGDMPSAGD